MAKLDQILQLLLFASLENDQWKLKEVVYKVLEHLNLSSLDGYQVKQKRWQTESLTLTDRKGKKSVRFEQLKFVK